MSYALVAWDPPAGADPGPVRDAVLDAMTHSNGTRPPVRFLDRVALYRSRSTGVNLGTIRDKLRPVVAAFPGTEIMIIMPDSDDEVVGWFDPRKGTFPDARPIMNSTGDLYPLLWRLRGSGAPTAPETGDTADLLFDAPPFVPGGGS